MAKTIKNSARKTTKVVKKAVPVKKAVAKKPVAKKPVAKKPVAKKPVAKKPVAKKPVAKKPVAKKPVAKKPVAKKPVAAPYSAKEINELRIFLQAEEARIEKRFNGSKSALEPMPAVGDEAADVGGENFMRETGLTLMMGDSRKLRMIKESIQKLSRGEFGICQDCGKPIGMIRLRAKPYAKYCINCKEQREKRGDTSGDSII